MTHVYILACKGIPAKYGGFETFVENLTAKKVNENIKYYVSCMDNNEVSFEYNNAECFNVKVPFRGAFGRMMHVCRALKKVIKKIKNDDIKQDQHIVYILGCRVGPFLKIYAKKLKKLNCKIFCNPDGLEWKRDKWSSLQKKILKICEKGLVLNSDIIVCDSLAIEEYIKETYPSKSEKTVFIAYGADIVCSTCNEDSIAEWYTKFSIRKDEYFLIVGRFVPENNYEIMIREFLNSTSKKDLVIITNVEQNKFYKQLREKLVFEQDKRIKFVGTVYDQELLKKIRENAFAYIHGHEVGGTNPSLLEALASTDLNLLLDVSFNREVGSDCCMYWDKSDETLKKIIESVELLERNEIEQLGTDAKKIVNEKYNWQLICQKYEILFAE